MKSKTFTTTEIKTVDKQEKSVTKPNTKYLKSILHLISQFTKVIFFLSIQGVVLARCLKKNQYLVFFPFSFPVLDSCSQKLCHGSLFDTSTKELKIFDSWQLHLQFILPGKLAFSLCIQLHPSDVRLNNTSSERSKLDHPPCYMCSQHSLSS